MLSIKKLPRRLRIRQLFTRFRNLTSNAKNSNEETTSNITSTKTTTAVKTSSSTVLAKNPSGNPSHAITKEDMKWRTPWHQQEGEYFSMLRGFYDEENHSMLHKMMTMEINLRPSAIKKWWKRKMEERDIIMQSYLPERNQTLGNELAAAHFIVHRGGAVKFHGEKKWIKQNEDGDYDLPRFFEQGKVLEAIDFSGTNIYYEGLVNFRDLQNVQWLSFNNCKNVDDWCIDRISAMFKDTAVYLDLRNCTKITHRGLCALYKMVELKILLIDNLYVTESFELTGLLLQQVNPKLDIRC